MGAEFGKLLSRMKEKRIFVIGLDSAGKITILHKLRVGNVASVSQMGYTVDTVRYNNVCFHS